MIVSATGHRLHLLPGYRGEGSSHKLRKVLLETALGALEEWHPDAVIVGMATGWDMAVGMAAMVLNIPFRAYVPFEGQDARWSEADRTGYRSLLDMADQVRVFSPIARNSAYYERDMAMADDGDRLIALYCGDPRTGTGRTIAYAEGWLTPWTNYAEDFMSRIANGPRPD